MIGWLVARLIGLLVGWLAGWLAGLFTMLLAYLLCLDMLCMQLAWLDLALPAHMLARFALICVSFLALMTSL